MAPPAPPSRAGRGLPRALRTVAPLAAVAAVVSGCTFAAPQDTQRSMVPGAGLNFTLSDTVSVSSLLIVAREADEPGVLVARVVNSGSEPVSVTITGAGLDEDVDVPAGQTVEIGGVDPGSQTVIVDSVPQGPGYVVPLTFSTADGRARESAAPVLDGTFGMYEPYLSELPKA